MVQHLVGKPAFYTFILCSGLLMMNAGLTNGAGMVGLAATLSHMTGVTTRIGTSVALGNWLQLTVDLATLFAFWFGCALSAAIVGPDGKYKLNWRFSVAFYCEAIALGTVALYAPFDQPAYVAKALIAFSMGVQNGITSVWSGGLGRSTHLTGFLADTAIIAAFWAVSMMKSDMWKMYFMVPFLATFCFGAFLGGLGFKRFNRYVFLIPATVSFVSATGILYRDYQARQAKLKAASTDLKTEIVNLAKQEGAAAAAVTSAGGVAAAAAISLPTPTTPAAAADAPATPSSTNAPLVGGGETNEGGDTSQDKEQGKDFLSNDFT
jgi:uncharacterized membrane protein YoaK (UPF0700 family)